MNFFGKFVELFPGTGNLDAGIFPFASSRGLQFAEGLSHKVCVFFGYVSCRFCGGGSKEKVRQQIGRHADEDSSRCAVEQARSFLAKVQEEELHVSRAEEPLPVAQGGQHRHNARKEEQAHDEQMGEHAAYIWMVRLPSACSSMDTFTASGGRSSSISSGHSMKQSAPL